MTETPLMSIGEFSSLSRLSVRMLRHYDAHRVLVPAEVDPFSGRRRYRAAQLADAADIRTLRDIGLGVSAIAALLATRGTPEWEHALILQRATLADELAVARGRLTLIDHLLHRGETMPITVTRTTIDPMTIVALRGTVPTYSDEGMLWQRFTPLLQAHGITPIGPGGVIEHDREYTERDVDLEIFLPVAPGTTLTEVAGDSDSAAPRLHELPARDCLVAEVVGPYTLITSAHEQIGERLTAEGVTPMQGDSLAALGFNIYLNTPGQVPEDQLVTRVHLPLAVV